MDDNRSNGRYSGHEMKVFEEIKAEKISNGSGKLNEAVHAVIENKLNKTALTEQNSSVLERNRALLQYIATLADSNSKNDLFNYEFVESVIKGGADINITDEHGQSMFHEVARSWNVDVAKFIISMGGEINIKDSFGRTPLHVAVSVDHVEMAEFLLKNQADIDARTVGELQAPIHYAAKNGSVKSLQLLLGYQANIDSLDYKNRTPLQLAGEWSRDKTAKVLIDEGASSCLLDSSGNSGLSVLIDRLPHLSLEALNQLHRTDVITRKEIYYLNFLETSRMNIQTKKAPTPLEAAVFGRRFEVVSHPVMQRLVNQKWINFGRKATIWDLCFYVIFNILWTVMSTLTPDEGKKLYKPLDKNVWRILLLVVICMMIVYQIVRQVRMTIKKTRAENYWIKSQTENLQKDLKYCHPRWPQEEKALNNEMTRINKLKGFGGKNGWFYYDWIVLIVMIGALGLHFAFYEVSSDSVRFIYTRVLSIANLVVSLRLLETVRPFPGIGTLVILLGETSGDFINWAFLFILLLVPFSASFWIFFGSLSLQPVKHYDEVNSLIYSVFRMAVGDDFHLEDLIKADPVMARILTVMYITAMTIVTLNLLIALLSDTFTRVHSNAVANGIMQRAIKVINIERILNKKRKSKYHEHIRMNCSPEITVPMAQCITSEDITDSNQLIDDIETIKEALYKRFAKVYGRNKVSDFDKLRSDIKKIKELQRQDNDNLMEIKRLLKQLRGDNSAISRIFTPNQWKERKIQLPTLNTLIERLPINEKSTKDETKKTRQGDRQQRKGKKQQRKGNKGDDYDKDGNERQTKKKSRHETEDTKDNVSDWDTVSNNSISL